MRTQRGGAAGRVALHGAGADAERLGDLDLGQVEVVAQREHLALPGGELPQGIEHGVTAGRGQRGVVGARLVEGLSAIEGVRVLTVTGPGEAWAMWPSTRYVVKVGGHRRETVPSSMVERYGEIFPSKLPGGALEGALPPGPEVKPTAPPKDPYDPNNPNPNLDNYDPDNVKIPEKRVESTKN